ncbi:hypothetical protein [Devosia sp.]|uniref:hypothetical protein n=1 Tax=Devosia sp. TaxID=1871048 RepID=UPI001AC4FE81|nr:hypothetical protein [Bauldia sp.]CAG1772492.1 hypothetical protein BAC2_02556 [uncultured bacterium]
MVAALLYLVGLITLLGCIAGAGYGAPAMIADFTAALNAGDVNMLDEVADLAAGLRWVVLPGLTGLVLMGLGRIIMLLGAINRNLRGQG